MTAPGPWLDAQVDPCRSGVHAKPSSDLPLWVGPRLYEIELAGEIVAGPQQGRRRSGAAAPARRSRGTTTLRDAYTRMCADRAHELALGASPPLDRLGRPGRALGRPGPGHARLRRRAHRRGDRRPRRVPPAERARQARHGSSTGSASNRTRRTPGSQPRTPFTVYFHRASGTSP